MQAQREHANSTQQVRNEATTFLLLNEDMYFQYIYIFMFLINKLQQEVETFVGNSKYEKTLKNQQFACNRKKKYKPEMQYPV